MINESEGTLAHKRGEMAYLNRECRKLRQRFIDIVKLYGTTLVQKYIAKDLDKISNILWQKEPTPLTVIDYYKELNDKRVKAVSEEKEREHQPK